jgi:peptidoglycan/xylan/chitin deacetylase (PgdA/CDA1 family)
MAHEREHPELAVLSYHKIGKPPGGCESWFYTPAEVFVAQMHALRDHGWTVIDVDIFLRGLDEPACLPRRAALITFDDGYASTLTAATPVLEEFGYPGVVFVPTAYVGGTNSFDAGVEPEERICRWDELRELARRGVSVQSHGVTHRAFLRLSREEIVKELRDSSATLEVELQSTVALFAFPYGDIGEHPDVTKELLRSAGYRAAFYSDGGVFGVTPWADRYGLTRVAVVSGTNLTQVLD